MAIAPIMLENSCLKLSFLKSVFDLTLLNGMKNIYA